MALIMLSVKRFPNLMSLTSHKGKDMADLVLEVLNKSNIDVINCAEQHYDNASNMSCPYKEMQAEIQKNAASTEIVAHVQHTR